MALYGCDRAKVSVSRRFRRIEASGQRAIGIAEARMIKDVEGLSPELELQALPNRKVLEDRHIRIEVAWAM